MSSLRVILEAAADQIRETMVAESDFYIQVEPTVIPNPTPPAIDMLLGSTQSPGTASFGDTYAQMGEGYPIDIRARVAPNDNIANQDLLYDLADQASDISLVQALYDDPTLGGVASDVNWEGHSGLVQIPKADGSAMHFGIVWRFTIIPARS